MTDETSLKIQTNLVKNRPLMYVFSFHTLVNITCFEHQFLPSTPRKLPIRVPGAIFTPPGCQTYEIGPTPAFKAASLQSANTAAEKNSPPESSGIT